MKLPRTTIQRERGFTLIEMLVIAPIVVLAIGAFLTVTISMVGDVLSSRGANELAYNVQDAMNRMEQDVKLSTTFLATNSIALHSGGNQGYSNDDATNFTNIGGTSGTSLILNELVTNGNPVSLTAGLVYLQNSPNDCSSSAVTDNTPMTMNVIYFVKNDPTNNNTPTLWRRTIMPANYATSSIRCSTPWQQPSCAPNFTSSTTYTSNICTTNDIKLVAGVAATDFTVQYFTAASSSSPNGTASDGSASLAARGSALASSPTVAISLNASQSVAGRTIARSAVLRATRLDTNASAIASIPAATTPAAPVVNSTTTAPANAVFTWASVQGATGYTFKYTVNGGSTQTGFTNHNTRTYTVAAPYNGSVVVGSVTAINSAGTSSVTTNSVTIPTWEPLLLQNNWVWYGSPFTVPAYSKTSAGIVIFKGLIKAGVTTSGAVIASLPVGYRPSALLAYAVTASTSVGRVGIAANGDITNYGGTGASAAYTTLEGVSFVPDGSPYTLAGVTMANSWVNDNANGLSDLVSTIDGAGRVNVQGNIKNGSTTSGIAMAILPTGSFPPANAYFPGPNSAGTFSDMIVDASGQIEYQSGTNAWQAPNFKFYPSSRPTGADCTISWCTLPLSSGWVAYDAPRTPSYTKGSDGIVTLRGLAKSGATATDTVIGTLPVDYRPANRVATTGACTSAYCRVDILPDGTIHAETGVNASWTSFDNVQFMANE